MFVEMFWVETLCKFSGSSIVGKVMLFAFFSGVGVTVDAESSDLEQERINTKKSSQGFK